MLADLCLPLHVPQDGAATAASTALAAASQLHAWAAEQLSPLASPAAPAAEVLSALVEMLWQSFIADAAPAFDATAAAAGRDRTAGAAGPGCVSCKQAVCLRAGAHMLLQMSRVPRRPLVTTALDQR